jgi:hypothetical protein
VKRELPESPGLDMPNKFIVVRSTMESKEPGKEVEGLILRSALRHQESDSLAEETINLAKKMKGGTASALQIRLTDSVRRKNDEENPSLLSAFRHCLFNRLP